MRYYTLIVLFAVSLSLHATPKKKLKQCQEDYQVLLDSIDELINTTDKYVTIELPISTEKTKKFYKTERKKSKHQMKIVRLQEKNKTNRNVFVNIRRLISQNTWAFVIIAAISFITGTPFGVAIKSFFSK